MKLNYSLKIRKQIIPLYIEDNIGHARAFIVILFTPRILDHIRIPLRYIIELRIWNSAGSVMVVMNLTS